MKKIILAIIVSATMFSFLFQTTSQAAVSELVTSKHLNTNRSLEVIIDKLNFQKNRYYKQYTKRNLLKPCIGYTLSSLPYSTCQKQYADFLNIAKMLEKNVEMLESLNKLILNGVSSYTLKSYEAYFGNYLQSKAYDNRKNVIGTLFKFLHRPGTPNNIVTLDSLSKYLRTHGDDQVYRRQNELRFI